MTIAVLLTVTVTVAAKAQTGWKMQPVVLQTRWAKEVNPNHTLEEYPRPQMKRANWENLNGLWNYEVTKKDESPTKYNGSILVPYPIESALSGVEKALQPDENLWYRRIFTSPSRSRETKTLLHFGAVDWQATVFVNGKEAGAHTGGYTAFTIDITDKLKGGENEIVVKVFDPSDRGIGPHGKQVLNPQNIYYTPTSGIWQTVWLETVPQTYVTNIITTPDIDRGTLNLNIQLNDKKANAEIEAIASKNGKKIAVWHSIHNEGKLVIPKAHLWSPEDPFLYDLTIRIKQNGKTVDEIKSYFGMRKISTSQDAKGIDRICLNNKPYYNLGTLDQGFWPEGLYTAPTDDALAFDIKAIKAMGFNTIRKHIKVEPAKWYYDADKIGMLVWQDMVDPNQSLPEGSKQEFEKESKEILEQLHNYPCITTWVVFNEEWGAYDQKRITKWVKETDPSRIVNGHSGGFLYVNDQKSKGADTVYVNSDMTDIHSYPNPMQSKKEASKAQVCGEFGGIGVSVAGHQWNDLQGWGYVQATPKELIAKYTVMIKRLKQLKNEGLSGSIYTQPFDVEGEENGLMTYDRDIIKMPVKKIREINSVLVKQNPIPLKFIVVKDIDQDDSDDRYPQLKNYFKNGNRDSAFLRRLTLIAIRKRDQPAATNYGNAYINQLKDIYIKDNLNFINKITRTSKDQGFSLFMKNSEKINSLLGPSAAERKVKGIIEVENFPPVETWKDHNPNIDSIGKAVVEKFGMLGEEVLYGRLLLYNWSIAENWKEMGKYYKLYFNTAIERSDININNVTWSVFENVEDLDILSFAENVSKYNVEHFDNTGEGYDTYANIVYKLGKREDALTLEKIAVGLDSNNKGILENYEKMKRGEKTWIEEK